MGASPNQTQDPSVAGERDTFGEFKALLVQFQNFAFWLFFGHNRSIRPRKKRLSEHPPRKGSLKSTSTGGLHPGQSLREPKNWS